jgi:hypothetical protein
MNDGIGVTRNENYQKNANAGTTNSGFALKEVANLKGANLNSGATAQSSFSERGQAKVAYAYWFTSYALNYNNNANAGATSQAGYKLVIGQGATATGFGNRFNQFAWQAPDDLIKGDAGGGGGGNKFGGTTNYGSLQWPTEKWSYMNTYSGSGNAYGQNGVSNNSFSDSNSESGTALAQGYYSGPPLYTTTIERWGYSIIDSKLSYTSARLPEVMIAPPIHACKTKPENFVWLAGGLHGAEPIAYGVAEVLIREMFAVTGWRYRAGFGNIGKDSWETIDNQSIISSSYGQSIVPLKSSRVVSGNVTNNVTPKITKTQTYFSAINTKIDKTIVGLQYSGNGEDDDGEDEAYPVVTTKRTQIDSAKWNTASGNTYTAQDAGVPWVAQSTNKYSDLFITVGSHYPFGELYLGGTTSFSSSRIVGSEETHRAGARTQNSVDYKQGAWTVSQPVGWLAREYQTDRVGYYYTDPDERYFNAKGVHTDLEADIYQCYNATCIDIKRFANAEALQTAKTVSNSRVDATRKSPRNARTSLTTRNYLSSQNNFEQTRTDKLGINPLTGLNTNSVSPYGERATYYSAGISQRMSVARRERKKICTQGVPPIDHEWLGVVNQLGNQAL